METIVVEFLLLKTPRHFHLESNYEDVEVSVVKEEMLDLKLERRVMWKKKEDATHIYYLIDPTMIRTPVRTKFGTVIDNTWNVTLGSHSLKTFGYCGANNLASVRSKFGNKLIEIASVYLRDKKLEDIGI